MTDTEIVDAVKAYIALGHISGNASVILQTMIPLLGTGPDDPVFVSRMYPFDKFAEAQRMARSQSCCGVFQETGWRGPDPQKGFVADARLSMPYGLRCTRGGVLYAITLGGVIAVRFKAMVSALPWLEGTPMPKPGDSIVQGKKGDPAFARGAVVNTEHVSIAAQWQTSVEGKPLLTSFDGGQTGNQNLVRTRAMVEVWTGKAASGKRKGELWCANLDKDGRFSLGPDERPTVGRRVLYYVDVSKLGVRP